ncbi:MAG: hypothetical protein K0U47_08000 [Epsilonproteobacteria bacterium]|nr:hypothetical protein [Campylobacterota bacterium]
MKYIWAFVIMGFLGIQHVQCEYTKHAPAEMIMMNFADEDDVESMDNVMDIEEDEPINLLIEHRPTTIDPSVYLSEGNFKVALLVPKKVIGAYADSVSNAIISYLLHKNIQFQFEVFDTGDEQEGAILQKIGEIKAKGFSFVIAPVTHRGANILARSVSDLLIYIPTINRNDMLENPGNILYGGIDYKRQIDVLFTYANDKIALLGDGSRLSGELTSYIKQQAYESVKYTKDVQNIKSNVASFIKKNKRLQKASIFLNMPIVKSSLIASQLRQYEIEPHVILSTQVGYNALLFKLTQPKDRRYFYIANSISHYDPKLKEINLILGNNPSYSWIDYSASIGMDYVFMSQYGMGKRVFDEDIYENQVEYKVRVEKAGSASFEAIGDGKFNY